MHILIEDMKGNYIVRKKSDIRTVYSNHDGKTIVCFNGVKNTPIYVKDTVKDFFNVYLAK